jgi:tetratricopeptide (TPR) repeat protein
MFIARNLLWVALILASAALAQLGGDLQAQILYAYQTEDTNSLTDLIQNLRTRLAADPGALPLHYHLAHAQYRMGLLAGAAQAHMGESAFSDCVDQLKPVLREDVKSVEALALQAACYSGLAGRRKIEGVLLRSKSADRLSAAMVLAPRNPRVVLLSAMEELAQSKPGSPARQRAFSRLQLAAQLFEESSATGIDTPGWGHAEAYLTLGRELQARGDRLGARNWIEKSLIAAPEFKAAQRQMALLVGR